MSASETAGRTTAGRVADWFTPKIALARVAWLRTVFYLFVILDMHAFVRDTRDKGEHPGLYQPLLLARMLDLPKPSVANTTALYVVLIVACLVGATNYFPRIAGWIVAPAFTWWVLIGMSDGKVDHDHLALVVALWVLPTVKAGRRGRASYGDQTRSEAAGWAIKCIQISVIATYFLSAIAKLRGAGWTLAWPNSAILTWAIVRRPHPVGEWLLHHPWMLHVMQWVGIIAEFLLAGDPVPEGPVAVARGPVLPRVPRGEHGDPADPLPADRGLLARVRAARAGGAVVPAAAGVRRRRAPKTRPKRAGRPRSRPARSRNRRPPGPGVRTTRDSTAPAYPKTSAASRICLVGRLSASWWVSPSVTSPGQQNANMPNPSSGTGSQRRPRTSRSAGRFFRIDWTNRAVLSSRSLRHSSAATISATWYPAPKIVCTREHARP